MKRQDTVSIDWPWAGLILVLLLGWGLCLTGCRRGPDPGRQRFHCPMHPTYISDRPGDCPICGMRLVPIREDSAAPAAGTEPEATAEIEPGKFYCPMHPEVVQDGPGRCPKCGMRLVRKEVAPAQGAASPAVPGRVAVYLSAEKRQRIGLTLVAVEKRLLTGTLRTVAVVEHDETRFYRVAPRFGGWIRELYANFTGAPVQQGQPLFRVYSPELYAAQQEYLVAWRAWQGLGSDVAVDRRESVRSLWEAARGRLELLEVPEEEIRALEERGRPEPELTWRSPVSGHVVRKEVVEGQAFTAGETLLEMADLSHLWARAFVFEMDLPRVQLGQPARIRFGAWPGLEFVSRVSFIYPHIDPRTRRAEVRLAFDNPEHRVRPDMWADVELVTETKEALAVPAAAVIDTGQRSIVFVDRADGHLEPREVRLGLRAGDWYEVRAGLEAGERVVSRALFLVDAESQLKAAMAAFSQPPPAGH